MNRRILLATVLLTSWGVASAQVYGPGMMWHEGWGMYGLMHILWWALAAFVVVMLVRRSHWRHDHGMRKPDQALVILRERYARGEIDKTEFEARKRDLVE